MRPSARAVDLAAVLRDLQGKGFRLMPEGGREHLDGSACVEPCTCTRFHRRPSDVDNDGTDNARQLTFSF